MTYQITIIVMITVSFWVEGQLFAFLVVFLGLEAIENMGVTNKSTRSQLLMLSEHKKARQGLRTNSGILT